ncbi:hypothetical protein [Vibrio cholerae]|uniref:hypothetical protein n=1 Tax=Vibrio cholerae TaxID=666 RepID=UPI000E6CDE84|nr:hypothetical protein [Vibrio cholerae]AYC07353.1 hypothetical protein FORC73_3412 [Vibrio cholerae]EGR0486479.1 hypothetical protein [Vibrio cholerae]EGR2437757.1 hypothetical protein [Vibrio cholerae]TXY55245.1 hypothetical protein FXE74_01530 [Vibrio cholerae]TYA56133.1 hypothetical protein FXE55_10360 [Vibrio cholerae]
MRTLLVLLLISMANLASADPLKLNDHLPEQTIGLLTITKMTQGQLLWLKGRVGEGKYQAKNAQGQECSIEVPVAIGSFSQADIGIHSTQGLMIAILSEAILEGQRIHSDDWVFGTKEERKKVDGYIVSGIAADEGFILNSRRRWISWLLDAEPQVICSAEVANHS